MECYEYMGTDLKTLDLSDKMITEIPEGAFLDCTKLEKIILPRTIAIISNKAFEGCISLKEIILPNSLKEVSERAFACCISLEKVTILSEMTTLGKEAFKGCKNLKVVERTNLSSFSIGEGTFEGCDSLKSVKNIRSASYLGTSSFKNCFDLDPEFKEELLGVCKRLAIEFTTVVGAAVIRKISKGEAIVK